MIHFAIAYWIMRKLVFEPALKIILAQESDQKNLDQKIMLAQQAEQESIKQKHAGWNFMKESLNGLIPKLATTIRFAKTTSQPLDVQPTKLSSEQKQKLTNLLHDELVDIQP